jgi:ribosomal protein S18 acetylase RimI-like enzyme
MLARARIFRAVSIAVREPLPDDVERLVALFDAYRVFYEQASDVRQSERFVKERLEERVTRFFVATVDGTVGGFVHLLPLFHTTTMRHAWLLEDLFVAPECRGRGAGTALMKYVETFARSTGAARISLTTAHSNVNAQRLYEAMGYRLDTTFRTYHRSIDLDGRPRSTHGPGTDGVEV